MFWNVSPNILAASTFADNRKHEMFWNNIEKITLNLKLTLTVNMKCFEIKIDLLTFLNFKY